MLKHRVIPCLLLRDGGLVKTTRFDRPKYVGDPINAIRIFNEKEVDELMVLDIVASRQNRGPDFRLIEQFAGECFMPLCYGGGISSIEQAQQLFALGVEKICLQTSILKEPALITRIAERFGSQSVVISVDVKRNFLGQPRLYSAMTRQTLKGAWLHRMCALVAAGAGEVLLNAVDRDGMMNGMDLDLIREASCAVDVPVTAVGGVGSLADIKAAINVGVSAVAVGAFFVFYGPHRAVLITYPRYEELEELLGDCV
jgi:imidazole glycerol-phosphate synthase subunit HisF